MTERPDLLQAQLNVEQQGIQLKFYRNQLFPELDLTGTYGYNGSGTQLQRRRSTSSTKATGHFTATARN